MYVSFCQGHDVVGGGDDGCDDVMVDGVRVMWVPTLEMWLQFHHYVRCHTTSHKQYQHILNGVCHVGMDMMIAHHASRGVSVRAASMYNPSVVYARCHSKMVGLLGREYGKETRETAFIDMVEARSAHRFADEDTVIGLMDAGLWNLSCTSGGRRGRTLASIQLRHMCVVVEKVVVNGEDQLVPSMSFSFVDEKYMDARGPRTIRERFHGWQKFQENGPLSSSFYFYRLLCVRGAFARDFPLVGAKEGDVLAFKPAALLWYLLCQVDGDVWTDSLAWSTAMVSDSTRRMLDRMGRPPRGHRAHRKGAVSRVGTGLIGRAL
jgi:hypothetical protein